MNLSALLCGAVKKFFKAKKTTNERKHFEFKKKTKNTTVKKRVNNGSKFTLSVIMNRQ